MSGATKRHICAGVLLLAVVPASSTAAHPISLTQVYAFVTQSKVTVRLEIFAEDLFLFHDLRPNDADFLEPDVIQQGIKRHQSFLRERFTVRDVQGERLEPEALRVKRFEMEPEGIPLADLMQHKLTFEMDYALDEAPEFLTFSQHLADDTRMVPVEMQIHIKQEGAGTPYEAQLDPEEPQTVRFSWDHPPLSADASQQQWDQWYATQKRETLGITSYSTVYSFLYINDHEVRHEILIPLLTLEESVLIARTDGAFLEIAEQDLAAPQIKAFFTAGNPILVDGLEIAPTVQRLDFYGLDFKDFAQRAQRRRVSMASARVGIILSYPLAEPPNAVQLTWDRFNRFIWTINTIVFAYDNIERRTLTRIGMDNVLTWENPGRPIPQPPKPVHVTAPPRSVCSLSLLSLGCLVTMPVLVLLMRRRGAAVWMCLVVVVLTGAGAAAAWPITTWQFSNPLGARGVPTDDQAGEIFVRLHANMYRAFDGSDEERIYDALSVSAEGDFLRELYLQIRRGLEMREQGGALSRVEAVEILEGRKLPTAAEHAADRRSFGYECRWDVRGTVEHWGHIHARTNQYVARFTVEPRDDVWKITAVRLLSERRVALETNVRGL
jgi:hypothetical protein